MASVTGVDRPVGAMLVQSPVLDHANRDRVAVYWSSSPQQASATGLALDVPPCPDDASVPHRAGQRSEVECRALPAHRRFQRRSRAITPGATTCDRPEAARSSWCQCRWGRWVGDTGESKVSIARTDLTQRTGSLRSSSRWRPGRPEDAPSGEPMGASPIHAGSPSVLPAGVSPPGVSFVLVNEEGTPRPRTGGRSTGSGYISPARGGNSSATVDGHDRPTLSGARTVLQGASRSPVRASRCLARAARRRRRRPAQ